MKRRVVWLVVSCLMGATLVLASCGSAEEEEEVVTPEEEEVVTPEEEEVVTPEEEEVTSVVDEILSRAKSVTSVKYEMVQSFPGATVAPALAMEPMKVWAKGNKMRVEMTYQGQAAVSILDADTKTVYVYLPAQNMAMKEPFTPPTTGNPVRHPADFAEWVAGEKPLVTGSETVDGKECLVAELAVEQTTGKVWIWKKYGIVIRMEVPNPQGGTIVMEWKNVEVVNIPDSMFELPAGVEIKEQ